jgi:hypothetical protein
VIGLTVEEASGPPVDVWECNWPAVQVFLALDTQWRVGMAGPTGLDYGAITTVLRLKAIPRARWPDLFEDIRTMEDAALGQMVKEMKRG